jgi:hypothetical protein
MAINVNYGDVVIMFLIIYLYFNFIQGRSNSMSKEPTELLEPKAQTITPNLNQYKLMQETSYLQKYALTLQSEATYFFFQMVNHRSPEGIF